MIAVLGYWEGICCGFIGMTEKGLIRLCGREHWGILQLKGYMC